MLISATNGKTTTASMLAAILESAGRPLVRNGAGSNMHWGVATALLDAGRREGELGIFEVDEAWLPRVASQLRPETFLLANLFRDQLDRYGEIEVLADGWAAAVAERAHDARFVLCADDPLVADLGRDVHSVTYFGLADDSQALPGLQHAADSKHCRRCGSPYTYAAVYMGHLGRYSCPGCGRERPEPQVVAESVRLVGMEGSEIGLATPQGKVELSLPLPGLYNVYNALAAAAAALALGAGLEHIRTGLEGFRTAFGRMERIRTRGRDLSILLVKNPAGANEVIRTLALEEDPFDLWIALNDRIADGQDVSWVWDADFEALAGSPTRVFCSGTRAEEMAMRLKYAGFETESHVERDIGRSLDAALADGGTRPLYALPTYTALLELRDLLARRGDAEPWAG